jgi:predicted thioesterase
MKPGLESGVFAELTFKVTADMCPHFDGVLIHPVCATWTIVHQMEVAGRKVLAPYLEEDEEGIGGGITVTHKAPTPIGSVVCVRADFESLEGRRLVCVVRAWRDEVELAEASFLQVVMNRRVLLDIFRRNGVTWLPPAWGKYAGDVNSD